ncbi:MAG: SurA N-terminal domain-containing protein [Thermoanaerobaculia bacterium]|nr:SurA N-terminal domain-containing protein [Thermoanaerobaculia bacterium]
MQPTPPVSSSASTSPLRRSLMLVATLGLAAVGWVLLDEPDAVGAAESRPLNAVAIVDGAVVTEDEVLDHARRELDELEDRRAEILERAVETKVCDLLIDAEAKRRGIERETLLRQEIDQKLDTLDEELLAEGFSELDESEQFEVRYALRWQAFMDELRQRHDVELLSH